MHRQTHGACLPAGKETSKQNLAPFYGLSNSSISFFIDSRFNLSKWPLNSSNVSRIIESASNSFDEIKTIKITVDEDMSYYKKVFKSVLYMSKNLIGKKVLVEYGFV